MKPDWLNELNELTDEHPKAEIVHMVAAEDMYCDHYRCATYDVSVRFTQYVVINGKMVEDEDDLREEIGDYLYDRKLHDGIPEAEFEKLIDAEIKKQGYVFREAIYVSVG